MTRNSIKAGDGPSVRPPEEINLWMHSKELSSELYAACVSYLLNIVSLRYPPSPITYSKG